jgi:AcrR family transcriptional regulator
VSSSRLRLSATDRREAVLDAACREFCRGSYRGTTTAEIARAAGITEPILYRHFPSKRDLYLACLEQTWRRLRERWEEAFAAEPDPEEWVPTIARTYLEARPPFLLINLWIQSLNEAGDDPQIRRFLRRQIREVHDYLARVIRRAQSAGGVAADRDAPAEAWILLSGGLLVTIDQRLGGLLGNDLEAVRRERRRWLTGGG